jgi:hypothetical protein
MRRLTLALYVLASAACAQTAPEAHLAVLMAAIAEHGCKVDESNADAVLAASGLTEDEASEAMFQLFSNGGTTLDANGVAIMITGPCAD